MKDPRQTRKWRAVRLAVLDRDGWTCAYCGKYANTVDHLLPVSTYPELAYDLNNLVACCAKDNSSKGNKVGGRVNYINNKYS